MLASGVLTAAITFAVLAVVFGLMNRSSAAPAQWADVDNTIELAHGTFIRTVLPWGFGVLPAAGLAIVAGLVWNEGDRAIAAGCVGLALFFAAVAWLVFREARHRVLVDPERITLVLREGVELSVGWDEVRELRFSGFWNALVYVGKDGTRVRVSMFLRGFDLLVALTQEKLDKRKTDRAFEKLLNFRRSFGS